MILVYSLKELNENLYLCIGITLTNLSFSRCYLDITERLYIVLNGLHTSFLINCRILVGIPFGPDALDKFGCEINYFTSQGS